MVRPTEFMVDTENFNVALGRNRGAACYSYKEADDLVFRPVVVRKGFGVPFGPHWVCEQQPEEPTQKDLAVCVPWVFPPACVHPPAHPKKATEKYNNDLERQNHAAIIQNPN